jgi:proline iminopeptidase
MNKPQALRRLSWKRILLFFLLILGVGLVTFGSIANVAYYGSLPADLPCRGCTGEVRSVQVNGFDLYYRELGGGSERAPIVILHGGPGHSSLSFKKSFDFLAGQQRVIYYDQRGSGNSQILPDSSAYSMEALVEELETLRRDIIQSDQMVVIGHSAGGALAQRYALKYPQHVERMILVSSIQINNGVTVPLLWDRLLPMLYLVGGLPPADPQVRDPWFAQINETGSAARLYDPANAGLLRDAGYLSFATWREVSRSIEGDDFKEGLENLRVPTLVIYGAADSSYTGEATASRLCGLLPECSLARFEHSGHWSFLEEPDKFAQTVRDFLAEK